MNVDGVFCRRELVGRSVPVWCLFRSAAGANKALPPHSLTFLTKHDDLPRQARDERNSKEGSKQNDGSHAQFYEWCKARGMYIHAPDPFYMRGINKVRKPKKCFILAYIDVFFKNDQFTKTGSGQT